MHVQTHRRTYPESEVYSERSDRTALDDTIVLKCMRSDSPRSLTTAETYGIPYSDGYRTLVSHVEHIPRVTDLQT